MTVVVAGVARPSGFFLRPRRCFIYKPWLSQAASSLAESAPSPTSSPSTLARQCDKLDGTPIVKLSLLGWVKRALGLGSSIGDSNAEYVSFIQLHVTKELVLRE